MRTLVVLAILAASLTRHIFTTTYLLKDDGELRQILLQLAETNSGKEAFCRGLLLSIAEEKQLDVSREKVSTVVREVLHRIQDLVAPGALDKIRSELELVVETAAQTWWTIQRRRSRFEADISTKSDDHWEWQVIEFNEDDIGIAIHGVFAADFASDETALVVFPRVFIVDEEKDTPVFPGVVLRRSQTDAANRESERIKSSSPSVGRTPSARSTRPRRMTFTHTGQNGARNLEEDNFLG
jgi:hypothetical protein